MIYIDIETVPLGRPDPAAVRPPKNYRDPEKIAEYQAEQADEYWRSGSFDPLRGRAVCIVVGDTPYNLDAAFEPGHMRIHTFVACTEAEEPDRLRDLRNLLLSMRSGAVRVGRPVPTSYQEPVTFNGRRFDLPFLAKRAVLGGVPQLARMLRPGKPWESHDLLDWWTQGSHDPRDRASMDRIAAALGIERPGNPIDGSQVCDRYLAGDLDAIVAHCVDDVRTLALMCERMKELRP